MNSKLVWIHVGLVASLASGFAAGILFERHGGRALAGYHHGGEGEHSLERFRARLELTDEQAAKVKAVLDGLHGEMVVAMNGFHDRFDALRGRAWNDVRAVLTPRQLPLFEEFINTIELHHDRR